MVKESYMKISHQDGDTSTLVRKIGVGKAPTTNDQIISRGHNFEMATILSLRRKDVGAASSSTTPPPASRVSTATGSRAPPSSLARRTSYSPGGGVRGWATTSTTSLASQASGTDNTVNEMELPFARQDSVDAWLSKHRQPSCFLFIDETPYFKGKIPDRKKTIANDHSIILALTYGRVRISTRYHINLERSPATHGAGTTGNSCFAHLRKQNFKNSSRVKGRYFHLPHENFQELHGMRESFLAKIEKWVLDATNLKKYFVDKHLEECNLDLECTHRSFVILPYSQVNPEKGTHKFGLAIYLKEETKDSPKQHDNDYAEDEGTNGQDYPRTHDRTPLFEKRRNAPPSSTSSDKKHKQPMPISSTKHTQHSNSNSRNLKHKITSFVVYFDLLKCKFVDAKGKSRKDFAEFFQKSVGDRLPHPIAGPSTSLQSMPFFSNGEENVKTTILHFKHIQQYLRSNKNNKTSPDKMLEGLYIYVDRLVDFLFNSKIVLRLLAADVLADIIHLNPPKICDKIYTLWRDHMVKNEDGDVDHGHGGNGHGYTTNSIPNTSTMKRWYCGMMGLDALLRCETTNTLGKWLAKNTDLGRLVCVDILRQSGCIERVEKYRREIIALSTSLRTSVPTPTPTVPPNPNTTSKHVLSPTPTPAGAGAGGCETALVAMEDEESGAENDETTTHMSTTAHPHVLGSGRTPERPGSVPLVLGTGRESKAYQRLSSPIGDKKGSPYIYHHHAATSHAHYLGSPGGLTFDSTRGALLASDRGSDSSKGCGSNVPIPRLDLRLARCSGLSSSAVSASSTQTKTNNTRKDGEVEAWENDGYSDADDDAATSRSGVDQEGGGWQSSERELDSEAVLHYDADDAACGGTLNDPRRASPSPPPVSSSKILLPGQPGHARRLSSSYEAHHNDHQDGVDNNMMGLIDVNALLHKLPVDKRGAEIKQWCRIRDCAFHICAKLCHWNREQICGVAPVDGMVNILSSSCSIKGLPCIPLASYLPDEDLDEVPKHHVYGGRRRQSQGEIEAILWEKSGQDFENVDEERKSVVGSIFLNALQEQGAENVITQLSTTNGKENYNNTFEPCVCGSREVFQSILVASQRVQTQEEKGKLAARAYKCTCVSGSLADALWVLLKAHAHFMDAQFQDQTLCVNSSGKEKDAEGKNELGSEKDKKEETKSSSIIHIDKSPRRPHGNSSAASPPSVASGGVREVAAEAAAEAEERRQRRSLLSSPAATSSSSASLHPSRLTPTAAATVQREKPQSASTASKPASPQSMRNWPASSPGQAAHASGHADVHVSQDPDSVRTPHTHTSDSARSDRDSGRSRPSCRSPVPPTSSNVHNVDNFIVRIEGLMSDIVDEMKETNSRRCYQSSSNSGGVHNSIWMSTRTIHAMRTSLVSALPQGSRSPEGGSPTPGSTRGKEKESTRSGYSRRSIRSAHDRGDVPSSNDNIPTKAEQFYRMGYVLQLVAQYLINSQHRRLLLARTFQHLVPILVRLKEHMVEDPLLREHGFMPSRVYLWSAYAFLCAVFMHEAPLSVAEAVLSELLDFGANSPDGGAGACAHQHRGGADGGHACGEHNRESGGGGDTFLTSVMVTTNSPTPKRNLDTRRSRDGSSPAPSTRETGRTSGSGGVTPTRTAAASGRWKPSLLKRRKKESNVGAGSGVPGPASAHSGGQQPERTQPYSTTTTTTTTTIHKASHSCATTDAKDGTTEASNHRDGTTHSTTIDDEPILLVRNALPQLLHYMLVTPGTVKVLVDHWNQKRVDAVRCQLLSFVQSIAETVSSTANDILGTPRDDTQWHSTKTFRHGIHRLVPEVRTWLDNVHSSKDAIIPKFSEASVDHPLSSLGVVKLVLVNTERCLFKSWISNEDLSIPRDQVGKVNDNFQTVLERYVRRHYDAFRKLYGARVWKSSGTTTDSSMTTNGGGGVMSHAGVMGTGTGTSAGVGNNIGGGCAHGSENNMLAIILCRLHSRALIALGERHSSTRDTFYSLAVINFLMQEIGLEFELKKNAQKRSITGKGTRESNGSWDFVLENAPAPSAHGSAGSTQKGVHEVPVSPCTTDYSSVGETPDATESIEKWALNSSPHGGGLGGRSGVNGVVGPMNGNGRAGAGVMGGNININIAALSPPPASSGKPRPRSCPVSPVGFPHEEDLTVQDIASSEANRAPVTVVAQKVTTMQAATSSSSSARVRSGSHPVGKLPPPPFASSSSPALKASVVPLSVVTQVAGGSDPRHRNEGGKDMGKSRLFLEKSCLPPPPDALSRGRQEQDITRSPAVASRSPAVASTYSLSIPSLSLFGDPPHTPEAPHQNDDGANNNDMSSTQGESHRQRQERREEGLLLTGVLHNTTPLLSPSSAVRTPSEGAGGGRTPELTPSCSPLSSPSDRKDILLNDTPPESPPAQRGTTPRQHYIRPVGGGKTFIPSLSFAGVTGSVQGSGFIGAPPAEEPGVTAVDHIAPCVQAEDQHTGSPPYTPNSVGSASSRSSSPSVPDDKSFSHPSSSSSIHRNDACEDARDDEEEVAINEDNGGHIDENVVHKKKTPWPGRPPKIPRRKVPPLSFKGVRGSLQGAGSIGALPVGDPENREEPPPMIDELLAREEAALEQGPQQHAQVELGDDLVNSPGNRSSASSSTDSALGSSSRDGETPRMVSPPPTSNGVTVVSPQVLPNPPSPGSLLLPTGPLHIPLKSPPQNVEEKENDTAAGDTPPEMRHAAAAPHPKKPVEVPSTQDSNHHKRAHSMDSADTSQSTRSDTLLVRTKVPPRPKSAGVCRTSMVSGGSGRTSGIMCGANKLIPKLKLGTTHGSPQIPEIPLSSGAASSNAKGGLSLLDPSISGPLRSARHSISAAFTYYDPSRKGGKHFDEVEETPRAALLSKRGAIKPIMPLASVTTPRTGPAVGVIGGSSTEWASMTQARLPSSSPVLTAKSKSATRIPEHRQYSPRQMSRGGGSPSSMDNKTIGRSDSSAAFSDDPSACSRAHYSSSRTYLTVEDQVERVDEVTGHNVLYFDRRGKKNIYQDTRLHILMLTLFLTLISSPKRRVLDPRYLDGQDLGGDLERFGYNDIPDILGYHLNHQMNKNLLGLLSKSIESLLGLPGYRLLKLLCPSMSKKWHYEAARTIAKGAFGTVVQISSGFAEPETVALKMIPKYGDRAQSHFASMYNEVSCMETCRLDHNVVEIFDYGVDETVYWMVMRYYPTTLRSYRRDLFPVGEVSENTVTELLGYFAQVVNAVQTLHKHGIFHYDLKCDNVMIDTNVTFQTARDELAVGAGDNKEITLEPNLPTYYVALVDFGESRLLENKSDNMDIRNRGTECIKPPEMLVVDITKPDRSTYDRRKAKGTNQGADVWALGCLFFELLAGEYLFRTEFAEFLHRTTRSDSFRTMIGKDIDILLANKKSDKEEAEKWRMALVSFLEFTMVINPRRRPDMQAILTRFMRLYENVITLTRTQNLQVGWLTMSKKRESKKGEGGKGSPRDDHESARTGKSSQAHTTSPGGGDGNAASQASPKKYTVPRTTSMNKCQSLAKEETQLTKVFRDMYLLEVAEGDSCVDAMSLIQNYEWRSAIDFRYFPSSSPSSASSSTMPMPPDVELDGGVHHLRIPWKTEHRSGDELVDLFPAIFDFWRTSCTRGLTLLIDTCENSDLNGVGSVALGAVIALISEHLRVISFRAMCALESQMRISPVRPDIAQAVSTWVDGKRRGIWRSEANFLRVACLCGGTEFSFKRLHFDPHHRMPGEARVELKRCTCETFDECPNNHECAKTVSNFEKIYGVQRHKKEEALHWISVSEVGYLEDTVFHHGVTQNARTNSELVDIFKSRRRNRQVGRYKCRICGVITHTEADDGSLYVICLYEQARRLQASRGTSCSREKKEDEESQRDFEASVYEKYRFRGKSLTSFLFPRHQEWIGEGKTTKAHTEGQESKLRGAAVSRRSNGSSIDF